jgi:cysteine desulfurase
MLYASAVIDFDHNATTPLDPRVRAAMIELLEDAELDGNPSSVHGRGRAARALVEAARRELAGALGADPLGVTFTSGGTEADALALLGTCRRLRRAGRPSGLLCAVIEHPAVLGAGERLAAEGIAPTLLTVDDRGRLEPAAVVAALRANPELGVVSIAAANHELGNCYDIPAIVAAVRAEVERPIVIHSDAVQAFGKVPIAFDAWDLDLMSVSSHKIYGPKGVGGLVHRTQLELEPLWIGGSQERGRRVGTESVIGIHGFGVAASLVARELDERRDAFVPLRLRLLAGLRACVPDVVIHGDAERTLGNTVMASFPGCSGELLLINLDLDGIAVSTGSACNSGKLSGSKVLHALGVAPELASSALRFSLGKDSRADQVDALLERLPAIIERVRAHAPRTRAVLLRRENHRPVQAGQEEGAP